MPGRTESGKIQKRQTRASPTLPIKQTIVGRRNIIRFNVKVSQYRGRCGDAKKPLESNLTPQSRCIGTLWSHKFVQDGEGATTERQPSNRTSRSACSFMHFNACKSFILTHCREVGRYTCTVTVQNALNDEIPHGNILHVSCLCVRASVRPTKRVSTVCALEYLSFSAKSNSIAMNVPSAPASSLGKQNYDRPAFKLKTIRPFSIPSL